MSKDLKEEELFQDEEDVMVNENPSDVHFDTLLKDEVRQHTLHKDLHLDFVEEPEFIKAIQQASALQRRNDIRKINIEKCYRVNDDAWKLFTNALINNFNDITSLRLDFRHCNHLEDSTLDALFEAIATSLHKLTSIRLMMDAFTGINSRRMDCLARAINNNRDTLKCFMIECNECRPVKDSDFVNLGKAIEKGVPNLEVLSISFENNTDVFDAGVKAIARAIKLGTPKLKVVIMNFNTTYNDFYDAEDAPRISDLSVVDLVNAISGVISNIWYLQLGFLSRNHVKDATLLALAKAIKENGHNLKTIMLNFEGCSWMTNDGVKTLCEAIIESAKKLNALDVQLLGNGITKDEMEPLKVRLQENFPNLSYFKFQYNWDFMFSNMVFGGGAKKGGDGQDPDNEDPGNSGLGGKGLFGLPPATGGKGLFGVPQLQVANPNGELDGNFLFGGLGTGGGLFDNVQPMATEPSTGGKGLFGNPSGGKGLSGAPPATGGKGLFGIQKQEPLGGLPFDPSQLNTLGIFTSEAPASGNEEPEIEDK